uniref:Embigin n=2 Tax=Urocitellus parryii TaxID=9999 RepID=A0A8D2GZH8_UROPR
MRALTGLRGPRAPRAPSAWPLLLVYLIAGTPWSLADGDPPDSPFTNLVGEEMMTKYSNLSLEIHSISLTVSSIHHLDKERRGAKGYLWTKTTTTTTKKTNQISSWKDKPAHRRKDSRHDVSMAVSVQMWNGDFSSDENYLPCLLLGRGFMTNKSSMLVEKNITLEKPSNMELTCQFTTSGDLNSINITWRKGDELLENNNYLINASGNTLYTQYTFTIINSKQMGSYSCFFEEEKEQKGTFNIKVPELHGKHKPLITYVGDSTVLVCKCEHCFPTNWTWYRSNGSVQVPVDVHMNDKYVINGKHANETRLKIMHLSEEDGGSYWCHAIFQLGESEEHIELVVLSFLVPLKPFLAIIAEVILLVAFILLCEMYTQKKKKHPEEGKEFEQIEQLKSDDSNGIENNAPRHRKIESGNQ